MKVPSTIKRLAYTKLTILVLASLVFGLSISQAAVLATANDRTDTVYFKSSAQLEFIEGECTDIIGWIDFDPADLSRPVSGIFRVDLRTLKTAIAKRDEHMRENHLHTDKYPYAFFEVNSLTKLPQSTEAGGSETHSASGLFYLHGVKRKFKSEFELSNAEDASGRSEYSLVTSFSILLDDYDIPRPKLLLLKLAKEIEIRIVMKVATDQERPEIILPIFDLAE